LTAAIEYPRFGWLIPGRVAGAPHPDLYDGLGALAPFLRNQRIGAIVTLYQEPLAPSAETFGFSSLYVETPDFRPPPDLPRILAFVAEQLAQDTAVLVHCYAGIGRTGTVLAAWLLREHPTLSVADAVARVRDEYIPEYARLRFPEDPSQVEALERFASTR
jgi:atypical dual specificity phosphatase